METYIGVSIDSWITLTSLTTMFSIHNHKSMFVYKLLLASWSYQLDWTKHVYIAKKYYSM